jgi:hypothetical protein
MRFLAAPGIFDDGDNVDEIARAHRIVNEVRARSEPQVSLDTKRECWRLRRRHKGPPGRAA